MDSDNLPEEMREEIQALKHGSYTIETEVMQALEEAENVEGFKEDVTSRMQGIIEEAKRIILLMGENVWSEIRSDYTDEEGVTYIDAFKTDDDNEEGKVIAYVYPDGSVRYMDERAITDKYAQEVINEMIKLKVK